MSVEVVKHIIATMFSAQNALREWRQNFSGEWVIYKSSFLPQPNLHAKSNGKAFPICFYILPIASSKTKSLGKVWRIAHSYTHSSFNVVVVL